MSDTASNQPSSPNSVSASRVIAADAQRLFDIVADPTLHHVIDGSGSVKGTRGGSRKLALGDKFTTNMRIGVPYLISNKVVEYVEGRRIAWAHIGGWRWRYEFEPVEGGTKVTETFDWGPSKAGAYINFMKWPAKNQRSIESTLSRLEAFATNASSSI
jgi:hypothetical protein